MTTKNMNVKIKELRPTKGIANAGFRFNFIVYRIN